MPALLSAKPFWNGCHLSARDPCFVLSLMALPTWANQLKSVRVWPSPDNTRVVLDMSSAPISTTSP